MRDQKVSDVIDFVSVYIVNTIRKGSLETVCIPYFGKFEAKMKQVGYIDRIKGSRKLLIPQGPEDDTI